MKSKKVIVIAGVASGVIDIALCLALILTRVGSFRSSLFTAILAEAMFFVSLGIDNQQKRCTAYTLGTITDVNLRHLAKGAKGYVPTVSYTVDGVEYNEEYSFARHGKDYYKVGDEFWVMYNPENPSEFTQEDGEIGVVVKVFRISSIIVATISLFITTASLLSV